MKTKTLKLFFIMMTGIFIISCTNTTIPSILYVNLTTTPVTAYTAVTATSGGTVSITGGAAITARGVCWSTTPVPTTANSKTTDGAGSGTFISNLSGLVSGTVYHLRAYAINTGGTYYGGELIFKTISVPCDTVSDIDGNVYNVVTIGSQCWMKENLKTSHYRDGTEIVTGLSDADWSVNTIGAYAIYNNDPANDLIYGKLYNWYAVNTGKLAPFGWHIPTDAEWNILTNYLGGTSVAGDKMKATTLWTPFAGIVNTNSSGFAALPTGTKVDIGAFSRLGDIGYFWTSTELSADKAWASGQFYNSSNSGMYYYNKVVGSSVRCIKN